MLFSLQLHAASKQDTYDKLYSSAYNQMFGGELSKAIETTDKMLRLNINRERTETLRGRIYMSFGQLEKAVASFTVALKHNPNDTDALGGRYDCWLQAHDFEKAIADLDQLIALNSYDPSLIVWPYRVRGNCKRELGQYSKAVTDFMNSFNAAVKAGPGDDPNYVLVDFVNAPHRYLDIAECHRLAGEVDKATEAVTTMINLVEDNPPAQWKNKGMDKIARYARGLLYMRKNDFQEALDDFTILASKETFSGYDSELLRARFQRGRIFQMQGKYDQAIGAFTQVDQLTDVDYSQDPEGLAELLQLRADCFYNRALCRIKTNTTSQAIVELNELTKVLKGESLRQNWLLLARCYKLHGQANAKNWEHAVTVANMILKKWPQDIAALELRANVRMDQKNYQEAAKELERILEIDPKNTYAYAILKVIQWLLPDKNDDVLVRIKAIEMRAKKALYPEYMTSLVVQGINQLDDENVERAKATFTKAIKNTPNNPEAYFQRGLCFIESNEIDLAILDFARAAKADTTYLNPFLNNAVHFKQEAGDKLQTFLFAEALESGALEGADPVSFTENVIRTKTDRQTWAVEYLNTINQRRPRLAEALYYRGMLKEELQQIGQAISDYNQALKVNPLHVDARYRMAVIFAANKQILQSVRLLSQCLTVDAEHVDALFLRGTLFESLGAWQNANDDLQASANLGRTYARAHKDNPSIQQAQLERESACTRIQFQMATSTEDYKEIQISIQRVMQWLMKLGPDTGSKNRIAAWTTSISWTILSTWCEQWLSGEDFSFQESQQDFNDNKAELEDILGEPIEKNSTWPIPLLAFMSGNLGQEGLLSIARIHGPEGLCQAWYIIGECRRLADQMNLAKQAMQNAIDTGASCIEKGIAQARLQQWNLTESMSPLITCGVEPYTGGLSIEKADISFEGCPLPLSFVRYYNSHDSIAGALGIGWTHNFEISLQEVEGKNIFLLLGPCGQRRLFESKGSPDPGVFVESGIQRGLLKNTAEGWLVTTPQAPDMLFRKSDGALIKMRNSWGNELICQYEDSHLSSIIGPFNQNISFLYDSTGRLSWVGASNGANVVLRYNQAGHLSNIKRGSVEETYQYPNDFPFMYISSGGYKWRITFDEQGRVEKLTDPLLQEFSYSYNRSNDGFNTFMEKNIQTNTTTEKRYSYTKGIEIEIDPDGGQTRREIDTATGLLRSVEQANHHVTKYQWDDEGRLFKIINPLNQATVFAYLGQTNLPQTVTYPGCRRMVYTYDASGHLLSITDTAQEGAYSVDYDDLGRVVRQTGFDSVTRKYSYGDSWMPAQVSDEMGNTIWDSNTPQPFNAQTINRALKHVMTIHDTETSATFRSNDNRITGEYDAAGNLIEAIFPTGLKREFTYTPAGYIKTMAQDGHVTKTFEYDPAGNVVMVQEQGKSADKIRKTEYAYDPLNRLSDQKTGDTKQTFTYHESGLLATVAENGRTLKQYDYDALGRFRRVETPVGELEYDYDSANGQEKNTVRLGNFKVDHVYKNGQLVAVEAPYFGRIQFNTTAQGSTTKFPNGVTETRIANITIPSFTLAVLQQDDTLYNLHVTLDPNGNISTRQASLGSHKILQSLHYDSNNQLIAYEKTTSEQLQPQRVTYNYDTWGNLTTSHLGKLSVQPDCTVKDVATKREFTWDDWGNLTRQWTPSSTLSFEFDEFNHLSKITDEYHNKTLASFSYDENGFITSRQIDGEATFLVYDGLNPIAEMTKAPDGNTWLVKRFFLYGPGIDYILGMVEFKQGKPTVYYFHRNERNDVVLVTDDNGREAASYQYDPWGKATHFRPQEDSFKHSVESPFLFRGCLFDPSSGLTYMRQRFYDPDICQFISPDPVAGDLQDTITTNPYAYARNNPYRFGDPLGTEAGPSMGELENNSQPARDTRQFTYKRDQRQWTKKNQMIPKLSTAMSWAGRKNTKHLDGTVESTFFDTLVSLGTGAVQKQTEGKYLVTDWSKGDPIRVGKNSWKNVNFNTPRTPKPGVDKLSSKMNNAYAVGKLLISLADIQSRADAGLITKEEARDAGAAEIAVAGLGYLVSITEAAANASGPAGIALTFVGNWAGDEVKEAIKQYGAAHRASINEEVAKMNQETGNFALVRQRVKAIRLLLTIDQEEPLLEARRLCWNLESFIWDIGIGDPGMSQQYDLVGKLKEQVEAKLALVREQTRKAFEERMAEIEEQRKTLEPQELQTELENTISNMEISQQDAMVSDATDNIGQTDTVAVLEEETDSIDDPLHDAMSDLVVAQDDMTAWDQPKTGKTEITSAFSNVIQGDQSEISYHDLDAMIEEEQEFAERLAEEGPMTLNRLFDAAAKNQGQTITKLVANGINSDSVANGFTPLMVASHSGAYDSCTALLKAGANPNAQNEKDMKWTPLHYAASKNHKRIIDLLMRYGARPTLDSKSHLPGYYTWYLFKDAELADRLGFGKPLADQQQKANNQEVFSGIMQALAMGLQAGMQQYQPPAMEDLWKDDDDTTALTNDELNLLVGAMNTGAPEDPGARGDPTVTLVWTYSGSSHPQGPDIDIWVTDPKGNTVTTSNGTPPSSADNGTFDYDDRGGWGTRDGDNGKGPERVYWTQGKAPRGTYKFGVRFYAGDGKANYTVRVYRNGRLLDSKSGTLTKKGQRKELGAFQNN